MPVLIIVGRKCLAYIVLLFRCPFNQLCIHLKYGNSLYQALAGEVGMSSELDEVARALFNGQLPSIWRKLAPATLKSLGNWMEHFLKRLSQYNKWVSSRLTPLIINILILN